MRVQLREFCGVRAGDKGNTSDIALFAYDRDSYELIAEQVTAERVREHFAGLVEGAVERFEVPNVLALNFVLREALGGGGPRSLRSDNLGKTLGGALLRMSIEVPEGMELARRPRPDPSAYRT